MIDKKPAEDMFGNQLRVGNDIMYLTHEHGYHMLNYGFIKNIDWVDPGYGRDVLTPRYWVVKQSVKNGGPWSNTGLPKTVLLTRPNIIKRGVMI